MSEAGLVAVNGSAVPDSGEALLARVSHARAAIERAETFDDVKSVVDLLYGLLETAGRQHLFTLEQHNQAQLTLLIGQRKIGWCLQQPDTAAQQGRPEKRSINRPFFPPTYAELGLKKELAWRYKQLGVLTEAELEALAAAATAKERKLTQKDALQFADLKAAQQQEQADPVIEAGDRAACPREIPERFRNQVVIGDARELAQELPDESIALCFCDPVYDRIADYEWVAQECERVLVPGGSLIVQCGNMRRFDCEVAMRRTGLSFVDLLAEVYPYAMCALFPLKVQVGWKPHLWFSKGKRKSGWVMNRSRMSPMFETTGKRKSDKSKSIHPWGDGEEFAYKLLRSETAHLVEPGEVIWDPFTGSGMVPVVAAKLGIPFVAFEIDSGVAAQAQARVARVKAEA